MLERDLHPYRTPVLENVNQLTFGLPTIEMNSYARQSANTNVLK